MEQRGKHPVIVAMKGQPCSGKSKLAQSIAKLHKWTLLDYEDLGPYGTQNADDLSNLQTIRQIAAAQLQLGINIIIDSPISNQSHLDQILLQLSTTTSARLLIVECKPQDNFEWRRRFDLQRASGQRYKQLTWADIQKQLEPMSDYNLDGNNNMSKLVVDTTKHFNDPDLYRAINYLATCDTTFSANFDDLKDNTFKSAKDSMDRDGESTSGTKCHDHKLTPVEDENSTRCRACLEIISGPAYTCKGCNNLSVHKSCAEIQTKIVPEQYPNFLKELNVGYVFPQEPGCCLCEIHEKDFFECSECLFKTNILSGCLPSVINHMFHRHPLLLLMYPSSYDFKFMCLGCGDPGKDVTYKCFECNYTCHPSCVMSPHTSMHNNLRLRTGVDYSGEASFLCTVCGEDWDPYRSPHHCRCLFNVIQAEEVGNRGELFLFCFSVLFFFFLKMRTFTF